jgi:hypothetical protein
MMIVATTLFFDPDWPRRMIDVFRRRELAAGLVLAGFVVGFVVGGYLPKSFVPLQALIGGAGVAVLVFHLLPTRMRVRAQWRSAPAAASPWRGLVLSRAATVALIVWVGVQVLLPFRHLVIPGNVQWTEEGQRFSWHLLVQSKSFAVRYEVTDAASGRSWIEDPGRHLTTRQISKLNDPDLLFQFARYLDDYYRRTGRDVEIRAEAVAQLNGRTPQHFVEPIIDLSLLGRPYIPPADWIVPLEPYD